MDALAAGLLLFDASADFRFKPQAAAFDFNGRLETDDGDATVAVVGVADTPDDGLLATNPRGLPPDTVDDGDGLLFQAEVDGDTLHAGSDAGFFPPPETSFAAQEPGGGA